MYIGVGVESSTNIFFKTPGEGGLEKEKPDQTIYIGFGVRDVEHLGYHHKEFYNLTALKDETQSITQINNISFKVYS